MIVVTRLDGTRFMVNAEMIEVVEETPDTVLTLSSGKKLIVKEPLEEVQHLAVQYRRRCLGVEENT